jgi:hypothetical protein
LKVFLTYSSLNAEISMDSQSLVRTKDTDKGDTIMFTTRVWFELNKWPALNCLRPFLNMGNLDFGNLPNNSAADGVGVSWFLTAGGVDPSVTTQNVRKLLEAQGNATVMFDNGGGHDGETWNNVTDKKGNASTYISGRPQARDLTRFKVLPVQKKGAVAIEVKLKGADTEKFLGEMIDTIGPALGLASGDVLGGLISGLTELAFRMHWRVGKDFEFPIVDWRICDKGWLGTITLSRRIHTNHSEPWQGFGPGLRSHEVDVTEKHEYTVQSSEGQYEQSLLRTGWTGQYDAKEVDTTSSSGNTQACASAAGTDTTTTTLTGNDSGHVDISLYVNDTRYQFIFLPGDEVFRTSIAGESIRQHVIRLSGLMRGWPSDACDGREDTTTEPRAPGSRTWMILAQPIQGTIDPKQPEHLTGLQEVPDPEDPSGKIIVQWDLVHCSGGKN